MTTNIDAEIAAGEGVEAELWGNKPGPLRHRDLVSAIAFLPRPLKTPMRDLAMQIQTGARWFWIAHKADKPTPASKLERKSNALVLALKNARKKIPTRRGDVHAYSDFLGAGQELANPPHNRPPPRLQPSPVSLPPLPGTSEPSTLEVWDIDRAIAELVESLDWLIAVANRAEHRARSGKVAAGGPRVAEPAYLLIRRLAQIFTDATGGPVDRPHGDGTGDDYRGVFLDFCEAVFDPMDDRSRGAISKLIERVLFSKPCRT